MKLGLFGGTFDPPHIGHLIVAQDALAALGLDRILFIPAGAPPHKRNRVVTPAAQRVQMLKLATAADPRFAVDARETQRAGLSYTADTVEELSRELTGAELFLLIGVDQFRELHTWHDPDRIARLSTIVVMSRGSEDRNAPEGLERFGAKHITVTGIDLSSTEIRRRKAAGESIRYLVPAEVAAFLDENNVYEDKQC